MSISLDDRIRELLGERTEGPPWDPAQVRLAIDISQAVARTFRSRAEAARDVLVDALQARLGWTREVVAAIAETASLPAFLTHLTEQELVVFRERFGDLAAERLRWEAASGMSLVVFVRRHGPQEALLLLDILFRMAASSGVIDPQEARALEEAAGELGVDAVLVSALFQRYDPRHAAGDLSWEIDGDEVTVGRGAMNAVVLPDPQVGKVHCRFVREGQGWRVVDMGSGRPVLLNGKPVRSAPVPAQHEIKIGPYALRIEGSRLTAYGSRQFTHLRVEGLTRSIPGRTLLSDVSFTVFSGEVVAMVGPSGAGKTTLINAIAGIAPADQGEVLLNGQDFHAILKADPAAVGIVPQEDVVHTELTVEESLRFAARLRLARDSGAQEVESAVRRVLNELGIDHIAQSRIGDAVTRGISGGQRKRVNLAQELLTRSTRVLFLDEPTSGLDPRSAQDIVRLVRTLADDGRIIFLVTHDLSQAIMDQVDHLLVMLPGGHVGFFGPPAEACRHFGVNSPDRIFDRLSEREPTVWGQRYRESESWRKYGVTRARMMSSTPESAPGAEGGTLHKRPGLALRRQLITLLQRYTLTRMRDRTYMAVLWGQPIVLACVMGIVFPRPTSQALFMLSLTWMWFGMSSSVRELISDRAIWRRERKVGVRAGPWLGAKILVQTALVGGSSILFTLCVWTLLGMGAFGYDLLPLCLLSVLVGVVGIGLGLLISSLNRSSEAAVGTLPLMLIPQICFSSILLRLDAMGQGARALSWLNPERYAFEGAIQIGDKAARLVRGNAWENIDRIGVLYELGLRTADIEDEGLGLRWCVLVLIGIAGLLLTLTAVQVQRDA